MTTATEKRYAHIGETCGCSDHDHDLLHELSRRLDTLWRVDQFIANADGQARRQEFWRDLKRQEQANVDHIKHFLSDDIRQGRF